MRIFLTFLLFVCTPAWAFAGENGFIYNGKTYVVYKDGVKVGKTIVELGLVKTKVASQRGVASVQNGSGLELGLGGEAIFYQEDDTAKCYYSNTMTYGVMSCVKK